MKVRKIGDKLPKTDREMIIALATLTKDSPIGEVLNAGKIKDDFKQNVKNLGS